jgi:DNA (cytosine-5)-methyltransferase 1
MKSSLNFVDIFSGAGGLSCGMEMAGWRCLLGVDFDKWAMQSFAANHRHAHAYCGDVAMLSEEKIKEFVGKEKIHAVVGGPPCQGFSTVGPGNPKDQRNRLFEHFVRIVGVLNPDFVVMENVTGLLAKKNEKTLEAIFRYFQNIGYQMDVRILSAEEYGVPERRRRTIIIGSKVGVTIEFPLASHQSPNTENSITPVVTVEKALKGLNKKSGLNHDLASAAIKNQLDLKRIQRIPPGKGIRYQKDEMAYLKDKKLRLNVDWSKLPENRFRQTKYQRLDPKKPSPTIMTHRHSYYHPTEDRFLTVREGARLQSFPDDFIFHGNVSAQWRQVGNAVPPLLGRAIGEALAKMIKKSLGLKKGSRKGASKTLWSKKNPEGQVKDTISNVRKRAFVYREKSSEK